MLKNTLHMAASAIQSISMPSQPVFNITASDKFDEVIERNEVGEVNCMCGSLDNTTGIAKMYETEEELFIACKKRECRRQVSRKITPAGNAE